MSGFRYVFLSVVLIFFGAAPSLPGQNAKGTIQVDPSLGVESFNKALDSAPKGSTLVVKEGTYLFPDSIKLANKQGITLVGKGNVVFSFTGPSKTAVGILSCTDITVKNIHLKNEGKSGMKASGAGIFIGESENISIDFCTLEGFGAGVYSIGSKSETIEACTIVDNDRWAVIGEFAGLKLIENDFERNGGLFFIDGKNIDSVGLDLKGIQMKDNLALSNGRGGNGFMPFQLNAPANTKVASPLSQELSRDN